MGTDAFFWLNRTLRWMVSVHWHSAQPQGLCTLCSVSISNLWRDVLCLSSSTSFMQSASEGSIPVNSDITHTVSTKFSELREHLCTVSDCKLMQIIWAKTNYPNAQCEVDCWFREMCVCMCVCVFYIKKVRLVMFYIFWQITWKDNLNLRCYVNICA